MSRIDDRPRRGAVLGVLGGAALLVLVALAACPPPAAAAGDGGNVTVYRASNASFGDAEAVEAAIASGAVEPAGTVTVGDVLVVAIESERLADTMNATGGPPTARFFTALDGDAEFRIIQTNPTTNANRIVASLGPENVTVHRDGTSVYVVVETADLSFEYRRVHRPAEIHGGERFAVQFGYDLPDDWSRGTVPDSPIVEFRPESLSTTARPQTTTTPTSSATTTSERSPTTSTRSTATEGGERRIGAPGMPGFTVPTALVALLVLAALRALRPRS